MVVPIGRPMTENNVEPLSLIQGTAISVRPMAAERADWSSPASQHMVPATLRMPRAPRAHCRIVLRPPSRAARDRGSIPPAPVGGDRLLPAAPSRSRAPPASWVSCLRSIRRRMRLCSVRRASPPRRKPRRRAEHTDGMVGGGDLLQRLTLVTLLAARGPVRWSAQAFGARCPRRLIEPVARRWLAAVGTIRSRRSSSARRVFKAAISAAWAATSVISSSCDGPERDQDH
jgi:hypothetical protein